MIKHLIKILAILTLLAVLGGVIYQLVPPSEAGRRAVDRLAKAGSFSLGPVGYAPQITEHEHDFFIILSSRHPCRLYNDLYERGTPAAKLYALCGIHLTHGDFEAYAKRFSLDTSNTGIVHPAGCFITTLNAGDAVANIRSNGIEQYVQLRQHNR